MTVQRDFVNQKDETTLTLRDKETISMFKFR